MSISIVVATFGRREDAEDLMADLQRQTRPADRVVFSVVRKEDAPDSDAAEVLVSEKQGSCVQRNVGLRAVRDDSDIVLFLDDDFVPHEDYLKELESVFSREPDIVGVTGYVVADGVTGRGLEREEALSMVAAGAEEAASRAEFEPRWSLYGCNMAFRLTALEGLEFDERLPLYGWLEDMDLSFQVGKRGRLVQSNRLIGAHRGVKRGRTPGLRFGYSQIANPVYLLGKGTAPSRILYENMLWNLSANVLKSARPEPFIDRRGRLRGNLLAIRDVLLRRSDPMGVLQL